MTGRRQKRSVSRMLWIGLTRGCPVCGQRDLFHRWISMRERCPRCTFRFERREGQFIGAVGMNTVVTFLAVMGVLVVGMILTIPDIPVAPLLGATLAVAVLVPLLFFPSSKTLWGGIDLFLSPLEPGESTWADPATGTVEGAVEE